PTPPRGDAVSLGYRPECECLERTCTSLFVCARRRTRGAQTCARHGSPTPILIHSASPLNQQGYRQVTPALTYSPPHRAALAAAPLDRILVETDAPVEYQGRASEPAHVLNTVALLAELRGLSFEETERITTRNALEFFRF
ncbi:MAG: TatD family hydrolase, partial [Thermodesulfobacteriota bacterium]